MENSDSGCGCFLFIIGIILLLFAMTALGMCGDAEAQRWAREIISG